MRIVIFGIPSELSLAPRLLAGFNNSRAWLRAAGVFVEPEVNFTLPMAFCRADTVVWSSRSN